MMDRSTTYVSGKGSMEEIVATDDRKTAAQYIERGYTLFTVPQMFGDEDGVIVLYREEQAQNQKANRMSKEGAYRVLEDYETASRNHNAEKGGELSGGGSIAETGGEAKTDEPTKPRLAEILGVEVGEEFAIKIFGKEVSGFSVHEDGILWQGDRSSLTAECLALIINYPDQIVRLPRLTEPELAICRAVGAKWVTRDKDYYRSYADLWRVQPKLDENGIWGITSDHILGRIDAAIFPSVKPGECIAVEEASEIV